MGGDRLASARAALLHAEESVGLTMRVLPRMGADSQPHQLHSGAEEGWEVPPSIGSLFPYGVTRGATLGISGARIATMLLAGIMSTQGAWIACIGIPDIGWGLASELGMNMSRTIHVPGDNVRLSAHVIATAIEGFDAVIIGKNVLLDSREKRLLSRKALSHKRVLLAEEWTVRDSVKGEFLGVSGMHHGRGHIATIHMELMRSGFGKVPLDIDSRGWRVREALHAVQYSSTHTEPMAPSSFLRVVGS